MAVTAPLVAATIPVPRSHTRAMASGTGGSGGVRIFGSIFKGDTEEEEPTADNIFGRILRGEAPAAVLDDGLELFSFRDKNPASTYHYLVIPKRFVRDASMLQPSDEELVLKMEAKARELIRKTVGDEFDERQLALGFHWPPWYSVPWLHLHAIYPKSSMRRKYKYTAFSFKSPEYVLYKLRRHRSKDRE